MRLLSQGSVQLAAGELEWKWSRDCQNHAVDRASLDLQRRHKDLISQFLKRQDDLTACFIDGLLGAEKQEEKQEEGCGQHHETVHMEEEGLHKGISATWMQRDMMGDVCPKLPEGTAQQFTSSEEDLNTGVSATWLERDMIKVICPEFPDGTAQPFTNSMEMLALKDDRTNMAILAEQGLKAAGIREDELPWLHKLIDWWVNLEEPRRTSCLARLVFSHRFDCLCLLVITINTVFMVSSANYAIKHPTEAEPEAFVVAEMIFIAFFAFELMLKLAVHGMYFFLGKDMGWNIFDFVIVAVSFVSFLLAASVSGNVAFLRSFRILKVSRIFRIFRVVNFMNDLRVMLNCVLGSFVILFWCFTLLALIGLAFAMFFVQSLTGYLEEHAEDSSSIQQDLIYQQFGSVQQAMITLYRVAFGGIESQDIYEVISPTGTVNVTVLLFFLGFYQISLINIVTGLFVEKAMRYAVPDHDMAIMDHRREAMAKVAGIKELCHEFELARDGTIRREDFMHRIRESNMRFAFDTVGMDIRDAETFFDMLMAATGNDHVDLDTFVAGCMRMRGHATSVDLQTLGFEVKKQNTEFKLQLLARLGDVQDQLNLALQLAHSHDHPHLSLSKEAMESI